jgi:glutathione S-transferase
VMDTLSAQLATGPWLLGERFTAADVIWGTALQWTTQFKIVSATPEIAAYIARFAARPAIARAQAKDAAMLDQQS